MTITASRAIKLDLGGYENVTITRTIEGIPEGTDPEAISLMLDNLMLSDIIRAREATTHPESDDRTSVYYWAQLG